MALVDDQQGETAVVEARQVAHHRLHRAEDHLAGGFLAPQAGTEDVRFEPVGPVLGMVLLDQLTHVGQHQHPATCQARQLGDDQRLAAAGGQHHHRRRVTGAKMFDDMRHGLALIRA